MFHLSAKRRVLGLGMGALALSTQLSISDAAMAISLPANKKMSFHLPTNDKLDESVTDGDTTGVSASDTTDDATAEKPVDLSPMKLKDDKEKSDPPTPDGVMKTGASVNDFAPKGPLGDGTDGLPATSIKPEGDAGKGKKGKAAIVKKTTSEIARDVNVGPLALRDSAEDVGEKAELLENNDKKQIADLWDATLERSPDIQFVVQKLVPTTDKSHGTHIMMKMLSTVVYGGIGSVGMMSPTQSTYIAQNFAASLIGQINGAMDKKQLARMALTQGEIISLYQMVRSTADRLVDQYRSYKKFNISMTRAATDLDDLRNMAKEAQAGQDASKQLEMQYTLRKAQRDVDEKVEDVHRFRQNLMDLAGPDAITKLDNQIQDEIRQLDDTKIPASDGTQIAPKGPGTL